MLQICDSTGHWTAVCDYGWDCDSANAACNDLGYNSTSKCEFVIQIFEMVIMTYDFNITCTLKFIVIHTMTHENL